jgi:hypothetical protein
MAISSGVVSVVRLLGWSTKDCQPSHNPSFRLRVTGHCAVHNTAIIPDNDFITTPLVLVDEYHAGLKLVFFG